MNDMNSVPDFDQVAMKFIQQLHHLNSTKLSILLREVWVAGNYGLTADDAWKFFNDALARIEAVDGKSA